MDKKTEERPPVMSAAEVADYLEEVFPAVDGTYEIIGTRPMGATVRTIVGPAEIRPGGTVSGPTLFKAADVAFCAAVLGMIGKVAMSVTANATVNFLRKPAPKDVIAEARILKLGRLLATGDVMLYSEGDDKPVAHATMTYAIPPQ